MRLVHRGERDDVFRRGDVCVQEDVAELIDCVAHVDTIERAMHSWRLAPKHFTPPLSTMTHVEPEARDTT